MTLQQVADHAGVSASTVSRVINAVPGITAETAQNVHRAMQALAYTPNSRRRSGTAAKAAGSVVGAKVAFVVLDLAGTRTVPAYDHLLRGVSAAAARYGLDLHVSFMSDVQSAVSRLTGSAFDGLILHGTFHPLEQSRPLHKIPTVWLMGNRRRPIWGDQVMTDNAGIGQLAARYLLRNGHRHAMYFGLRSGWFQGLRMLAFEHAMFDAGGTVVTALHTPANGETVQEPLDVDAALAAFMKKYRALDSKPTGLFVAEDWLVRVMYHRLRAEGLTIGRGADIEVVSCNNDRPHLVGVDPMPTTIDIRYEEIAYRAVEQLTHRLTRSGPEDRVRIMLEPALVPPLPAE